MYKRKSNQTRYSKKIIDKITRKNNIRFNGLFGLSNIYEENIINDHSINKLNHTSDSYQIISQTTQPHPIITRPQTSKGFRKNKQTTLKSNNIKQNKIDLFDQKTLLKSTYHSIKTQTNQNQIHNTTIEITLNQQLQNKIKKKYHSFQTQISQDFLSLFAN